MNRFAIENHSVLEYPEQFGSPRPVPMLPGKKVSHVPWKPRPSRTILFFLAAAPAFAAAPAKLDVAASSRTLVAGQTLRLRITLLDAADHPAPAPRPFPVQLQLRTPSNAVVPLSSGTIPAGQSSLDMSAPLRDAGLVYVWARNPELLPGGQFVNVRPPSGASASAAHSQLKPIPVRAAPPAAAASAPAPPPPPRPTIERAPASVDSAIDADTAGVKKKVVRAEVSAPAPPPSMLPAITLRYSPQRDLLANGSDPAAVEAFLVGDVSAAPADIRLTLFDSTNSLKPAPLVIPAGQSAGRSTITSSQPGAVTIEFLGSNPRVEFQGGKTLSVRFVPPISRVSLQASPPRISLVDTAELIVSLADAEGRNWVTDSKRPISLYITSGRGQITRQDIEIPAGQFETRARFVPEWPGVVSVSAATPNLLTVNVPLSVTWPLALLFCSALGGMIGGFLSKQTRKRGDKWRVPTGLFTGFLFYWACIFLGVSALLGPAVLNPLSALAVSAVGGWLQTEVFTIVGDLLRPRAAAGA